MFPSMVRIHSPKGTCLLPPARPCPQQAGPTVGASDVKPVASSSLPTLTAKFTASPSGANRYYVCPETEKQRSKTAPGDPNREYLKYQRNGKWGPGICLIYPLYGRSRKSFLSLLGRRFWGSREGQGGPGLLAGSRTEKVVKSSGLGKVPYQNQSHLGHWAQIHGRALGILLKCRFRSGQSGLGPKLLRFQQAPRC